MKKLYTIFAILSVVVGFAQIPSGYYNTATGTGYTLKTQLKRIIDDATDGIPSEHISIDRGYAGLYVTYSTSDIDLYYENNGTMLDMYTENPTGPDVGSSWVFGIHIQHGTVVFIVKINI
jgi:hypothetical protein